MAATYLVLNLIVIGLTWAVLWALPFIRRSGAGSRTVNKVCREVWLTLAAIMVMTLVFDNIMIKLDLFHYDSSRLLGLYIGRAPLEDLMYPVLATLLVIYLWRQFSGVRTIEPKDSPPKIFKQKDKDEQ